jgi:hypothetical protein
MLSSYPTQPYMKKKINKNKLILFSKIVYTHNINYIEMQIIALYYIAYFFIHYVSTNRQGYNLFNQCVYSFTVVRKKVKKKFNSLKSSQSYFIFNYHIIVNMNTLFEFRILN